MSQAETLGSGLRVGTPEIRSVGPIASGPAWVSSAGNSLRRVFDRDLTRREDDPLIE